MAGALFAFGGKGGSGKTTVAALVVRQLVRMGVRPVLAVDADPNASLGLTLGVEVPGTIADLRDRMGEAAQEVSGISKDRLMGLWLSELLGEGMGFDLLTLGRPEGARCYCYVNSLLRRYLKELRGNYAAVVVDCEAGMEYLSRLTVEDIDALVLVAEATAIGLTSARRIAELAATLPVGVRQRYLVLNKIGQAGDPVDQIGPEIGPKADVVVRVPFDPDLLLRCTRGDVVDESAGPATRPAIEELTRLCIAGVRTGLPPTEAKELTA